MGSGTLPNLGGTSQWYCLHRISPHRGEFATFAKTVAIRGDFMLKCGKWRILLQGVFFFWPPPNFTKSQAPYKFLYLENFRGGQFKLYRAWDLVKFRGGQKKKHPVPAGFFLNRFTATYTCWILLKLVYYNIYLPDSS